MALTPEAGSASRFLSADGRRTTRLNPFGPVCASGSDSRQLPGAGSRLESDGSERRRVGRAGQQRDLASCQQTSGGTSCHPVGYVRQPDQRNGYR
jgi:hypothetical protein